MLQKTRALRRASAVTSARAATQRPMTILGVSAAALVGITLSVGLAATPAAGAVGVAAASEVSGAEPLVQIMEDAVSTQTEAEEAVEAAEELSAAIVNSGLDLEATTSIDTSDLEEKIDQLDDSEVTPVLLVGILADDAEAEIESVVSETESLEQTFIAAQEKKAAEEAAAEAARVAAEKAAAEAKAAEEAAAALASANTVEGAKVVAQQMLAEYGWSADQFSCLDSLWSKESGWNYQAYNASSGATGIPQALPGSKMASAGADWQTNAATQIAWGLEYISSVYGNPCGAWAKSQAVNWY